MAHSPVMGKGKHIDLAPGRRRTLAYLGAGGFALLTGDYSRAAERASALACVARPRQTEGPFFVDEKLNRADIRSDPLTKAVSEGTPLQVVFRVSQTSGDTACAPLPGAQVDVWQCDANGLYSDVQDFQRSTAGLKFLRGHQITDNHGNASFLTIFPGWYPGRAVHIHFKVRARGGREFTSQIYFDDALTDAIHAQPPYLTRGQRRVRNSRDAGALAGGGALILPLREEKNGYLGIFDMTLAMA
ncbi:MAG TPA: protocatechuate 3,4-dioxygenase [Burkholderiales bacterium]|nr:protocatechuate 3,4-dioxygenase [Burkholderiales bacterium]